MLNVPPMFLFLFFFTFTVLKEKDEKKRLQIVWIKNIILDSTVIIVTYCVAGIDRNKVHNI